MLKTSLNIKIQQKIGEKSKKTKTTTKKPTSSVKDVFYYEVILTTGFPHTQLVKNPPAMQETPV